jgi:anaerobic magnesium-protoporphyrin IX monomethyl ester cyclase
MRILIINPPHESIGSRMPGEMLPPLGLLAIGGPLIDDGHDVALIDGDVENLPLDVILGRAIAHDPQAILIGHNGSTSAHPTVAQLLAMLRAALPNAYIIYGGVFPTYHWKECLDECPEVDVIVRGEGEDTARILMRAIEDDSLRPLGRRCPEGADEGLVGIEISRNSPTPHPNPLPKVRGGALENIPGIAFRCNGEPTATPPAPMIQNLDDYRVGWELIDHARYSYYGGKRGVVMQFSRGCPHLCSYCGQRGFWTRWRHRDPKQFAAEIARLHREHGVRFISFADENPTTSKKVWRELLKAIIAENVPIEMIATLRADDIVRDADILHLYRQAGFVRFLIGMEHTDALTLEKIRKGGATKTDREAIKLLRRNGILSLCSYVVGFEDETLLDYLRAFRQLLVYDPDQIITLYVTPHRWTPFFRDAKDRRVIQLEKRRWDYKNQVLENKHLAPWVTFVAIKTLEVLVQARPKALARTYFHPDRAARAGMQWYSRIGKRVWLNEVWWFMTRDHFAKNGPTLAQFWGAPQDAQEEALKVVRVVKKAA